MDTATPPVTAPRRPPARERRERIGVYLLVMALCVGVAAWVYFRDLNRAKDMVEREDLARASLLRVAEAEAAHRADAGRYGWALDLKAAGRLDGMTLVEDETGSWIRTPGYRIEVLLPTANLGAGVVAIATRHVGDVEAVVDVSLAKTHFAVVARPLEPGRGGYRMWYIDDANHVFLNEGVIDDEGASLNALPRTLVRHSAALDTADLLLWQRESEVLTNRD